jgi:regulation of enolase protein 1 (concanavalin A-like superfamily)
MRTKSDWYKISIKKKIREKQITIKRMGSKVDIKIKFNQILEDEIEKKRFKTKYIAIKRLRIKFDIINK